ncbi:MAG: hypothetical protein HY360_02975 [Verrucomicrobia bacterium]|nr:hypothetical protein [Verrucomicrobiota bacterium]
MTVFLRAYRRAFPGIFLLTVWVAAVTQAGQENPSKGSILMVTAAWAPNVPYRHRHYEQYLRAQGYQTAVIPFHQLSDETLAKFNMVMFLEFARINDVITTEDWGQCTSRYHEELARRLENYVNSGGGLLFFSVGTVGGWRWVKAENKLLQHWGAEYLLEMTEDVLTRHKQANYLQNTYFLANQIARSPLTEGVTNIWYTPHFYSVPLTQPLKVDSAWKVAVSGSRTAMTRPIEWDPPESDQPAHKLIEDKLGTYQQSPPLVAYKEMGKGRIVLLSFSPINTVFGYQHPFWEDLAMTRGNGRIGSDLLKLLDNSVAFLVQPTKDSTAIGGYVGQPYPKDPQPQPIDWSKMGMGKSTPKLFTGVIGARTTYSVGKGAVTEWAAAAKQAGLDYLVFADTFAQLTPEKWNSLKEDCKKASTNDFLAIPGYEIQTESGDRWIAAYYGGFPAASILTADGRKIKVGQSDSFYFSACNSGFVAPFDLTHNPTPTAALSVFSALGCMTYEKGKLHSESLQDYLHDAQLMDFTVPVAIDLVDLPEDIKTFRQRAYNQINAGSLAEVESEFRHPSRMTSWIVTSGPRILDWRGLNMSRNTSGESVVPGTERWRMRLQAESDVDLKEVAVYDGTTRIRRYLPQGKTFSVEIDGLHDQQRALVAIVTDSREQRAISGFQEALDMLMYRTMCSDHQNTGNCAFAKDRDGNTVMYGPGWQQEKLRLRNTVPGQSSESFFIIAPLVDGGYPPNIPCMNCTPTVVGKEISEGIIGDVFMSLMNNPHAGKFALVQENDLKLRFIDGKTARWGSASRLIMPVEPTRLFDARLRFTDFLKYIDGPRLQLFEGTLKLKRDVTLADTVRPAVTFGSLSFIPMESFVNQFTVIGPPSWFLTGKACYYRSDFSGRLPPGGYVIVGPHALGSRGFFALDQPLHISSDFKPGPGRVWNGCYDLEDNHINFGLHEPGKTLKAGTEISYRVLFMAGGRFETSDSSQFEWVRASMGLAGKPAYDAQVSSGKLKSTGLYLELEAADGGARFAINRADLPIPLPVKVHGVNSNWSTGIWDEDAEALIPCGVLDGAIVASLDIKEKKRNVFIGNVIVCDRKDAVLTLLPEGNQRWKVQVQNPTDKKMTVAIHTPKAIKGFRIEKSVEVPAGGQVEITE